MDGSNNEGDGRRNLAYAERIKDQIASIAREANTLAEIAKPYREEARAQIEQALPESKLPSYQRLLGVNREKLVAHGEGLIAALAGCNGRSLEQSQADAVADSLLKNARSAAVLSWAMFGGTLALTYRKAGKIPPGVQARMGSFAKLVWPPAVFAMYYAPVVLFVKPYLMVSNASLNSQRLQKDPRLEGLNVDLTKALRERAALRAGTAQGTQASSGESSIAQQANPQGASWGDYSDKGYSGSSPSYAAPKDWGEDTQATSKGQSQQVHSGWDDDDASPIAPSARSSAPDAGLSAWDRIRNEAISKETQGAYQNKQPQQTTPTTGGWGSNSDSRGSYTSNDYSFSSSDQPKNDSKDQAQREFDRLVDRERQGSDQNRDSWSRR